MLSETNRLVSKTKKKKFPCFELNQDTPFVTVLFALNEQVPFSSCG